MRKALSAKQPGPVRSRLLPCLHKPVWYPPLGNQDSAFGAEDADLSEHFCRHHLRNELAVDVIAHSLRHLTQFQRPNNKNSLSDFVIYCFFKLNQNIII